MFVKEYQKVSVSAVVGSILAGPCVVLVSLSTSLSAPQIIQLGRLPGSTKPLPARWHSQIKNPCVHVGVCTFRPPQLCLCVCISLCAYVFLFAFVNMCVWERENTLRESFDSTAFLSSRHLLPSPNLSVYQAKMLSERLLRQLDNPPNMHTYTLSPASKHPSSQHPSQQPSPVIYRTAHKHAKNTNTHTSSPTLPPLDARCVLCYPEAVWQAHTRA